MLKKILKFVLLFLPLTAAWAQDDLEIITSIKPFYNLVLAVTHPAQQPKLLLKGQASPHHYSLKPSEVQLLSKADLIFWGGPELEVFLHKPLANLAPSKIVQLDSLSKLHRYPIRHTLDESDTEHHHDHHHHVGDDPHFWLDPHNAIVITKHIADTLCTKDRENCAIYQDNARLFKDKMEILQVQIANQLKPLRNARFLVLHDAYQYFEQAYQFKSRGALHLHPDIPLSAKRVQSIRQIIQQEHIQCVFGEPQFQVKILQSLQSQFKCRVGQLDPIGQDKHLGPEGYFHLQQALADSLAACLSEQSN